jgi:xeroderma pigmentosum group C-complementing protein
VKSKKSSRWVHVDPHFELTDQPLAVESIRGQKYDIKKKYASIKKNSLMKPVSFVVAVEHTLNAKNNTMRLIDVSPRYANKWSKSLRLRGATAKEIAKSGGNCSNVWWSKTIKKANKFFDSQKLSSSSGKKLAKSSHKQTLSSFAIEKKKTGEEVLVIHDSSDDSGDKKGHNSFSKGDDVDADANDDSSIEADEFKSSKSNEAIPTSKTAFKNHPLYVIPSALKSQEVLAPDAKKRICGMFKGELVYKRSDVSTALTAKKWLYESHKVKENELKNPVKKIKARKKPIKKGFQALTAYGGDANVSQAEILASSIEKGDFEEKDDMNQLYGKWQTNPWSPSYIGPNDEIQVNEYKNVELALINPGLVHLQLHRISYVAKKLGIPYAPCLLGFEGHGGNRTPTVRGIVVHECNADLLREAHTEYESQAIEDAYKQKQQEIYRRWRRLINGVVTADRLKREYGQS